MRCGLVECVAMQDNFTAQATDRIYLDRRGWAGHDNPRVDSQCRGALGDPLSMVTGTGGNHPGVTLRLSQMDQFVVGTAIFERINRL